MSGLQFAWWLIRCKPRQEVRAEENLNNQGVECYLPWLTKRNGKKEPLFPGYLFVKQDSVESVSYASVRSTRGVQQFVRFGESFAQVSQALIEQIRQQEDGLQNIPEFTPSQHVEITQGPFQAVRAIYLCESGLERGVVLINMLNRQQKLEINHDQLQGVSEPAESGDSS